MRKATPLSAQPSSRSALRSALRVWHALYLREAVTRLSLRRGAWFWILLEPAEQVAYIAMLHLLLGRHMLPGINLPLFIAVGVLPFMLVRNVTLRGMEGLEANRALLHYRQIKPFDTALVRAWLEATLLIIVTLLLVAAWSLVEDMPAPHDWLSVLLGIAAMWLLGLGLALTLMVCKTLIPELADIVRMAFGPLYMLSGTMFPSIWIPHRFQSLFFLNPFLHGIEIIRQGIIPGYRAAPHLSPFYLCAFSVCTVTLGIALHLRFDARIRAQ